MEEAGSCKGVGPVGLRNCKEAGDSVPHAARARTALYKLAMTVNERGLARHAAPSRQGVNQQLNTVTTAKSLDPRPDCGDEPLGLRIITLRSGILVELLISRAQCSSRRKSIKRYYTSLRGSKEHEGCSDYKADIMEEAATNVPPRVRAVKLAGEALARRTECKAPSTTLTRS